MLERGLFYERPIIIEMTLGEAIVETSKIKEVKVLEVDIEGNIEMTILEEVEVGLGTDNIKIISEGMVEVVVLGLDQV